MDEGVGKHGGLYAIANNIWWTKLFDWLQKQTLGSDDFVVTVPASGSIPSTLFDNSKIMQISQKQLHACSLDLYH